MYHSSSVTFFSLGSRLFLFCNKILSIWCGLVFPPQTILSNSHPTHKHLSLSSDVGNGVVERVLGVDGEVDSLTELGHGVPVHFLEPKKIG